MSIYSGSSGDFMGYDVKELSSLISVSFVPF